MSDHRERMEIHARGIIEQYAHNEKLTWKKMIPELIDNALDAKARTFDFNKDGNTLVIKDDGIGCPDPRVMVSLGESKAHATGSPRSGRYGLGGKASCIRASQAGLVEIVSVHDGQLSKIAVD